MAGPLYRVGLFCARHHWPVIAAWIVVVIAMAAVGRVVGEQTSDNLSLPGTDSTRATNLLESKLPDQAYGSNPVVVKVKKGKVTDSDNKQAIDDAVTSLGKAPHVIKATNPLTSSSSAFVSKDKTIAYIPVTLDLSPGSLDPEQAQTIIDAADPAKKAGDVESGGYLGKAVSKPSTHSSEIIGLSAAVIILLFAFGTATAMFLPIATAVLGLVIVMSAIRLIGQIADVPTVSPTLATMIGLGVGIDYALFIVTRHKQQLGERMEMRESIGRATATAGGAVAFAGCTVVIALVSLVAAGIPLVSTLGYTAAIAVAVAVMAATTLLPALLGALGPKIDSLRVQLGRTHPDDHEPHGWRRWANGVARRPWRSMLVAIVLLGVLAVPTLSLHLGQNDVGALSKSTTARKAYDLLSTGFGAGTNGPLLVATSLGSPAKPDQSNLDKISDQEKQLQQQQDQQTQQATEQLEEQGVPPDQAQSQAEDQVKQKTSDQQSQLDDQKKQAENPATDPRLTTLEDDIKKADDVQSVSPATLSSKNDTAIITVISKSAPSDDATENLVNDLRDNVIPAATKGTDLHASVGGQTAGYIDLADRISSKLPQMIAIVVGLSFIVLMLAFRSILLPLKAALCNLLSVAAAYGIVTFVFQEGHGAKLIGLDGAIPIVSFVPLLMFAILFGLSMDYEVFLLTQIQDKWTGSKEATKAVVEGLASTGRVITSAALIMVCVFTSFVLNGDPTVKQFGVGLAAAIAIDATVVRCLLVPAIMVLLGKSSWWMPSWLGRALPKISIEGEEYFANRPAPVAPAGGGGGGGAPPPGSTG